MFGADIFPYALCIKAAALAARHLHRNPLQSAQFLPPTVVGGELAEPRGNGMRSTQGTETTKLHIGKDGTLRIPAHVVSAAQLRAGDEVTVHVKTKQLALVGGIRTEELMASLSMTRIACLLA